MRKILLALAIALTACQNNGSEIAYRLPDDWIKRDIKKEFSPSMNPGLVFFLPKETLFLDQPGGILVDYNYYYGDAKSKDGFAFNLWKRAHTSDDPPIDMVWDGDKKCDGPTAYNILYAVSTDIGELQKIQTMCSDQIQFILNIENSEFHIVPEPSRNEENLNLIEAILKGTQLSSS